MLFSIPGAFGLAAHRGEDLVAGARHFFRGTALLLDVRQGVQGFVIFLLGQVDFQQFIHDRRLLGKGSDERLVLGLAFVHIVLRQVHPAQQAAVPEIGAVQGDGRLEGLPGGLGIVEFELDLGQVVPDRIVLGSGLGKGLKDVPGLGIPAVPIKRHRIYEIALQGLAKKRSQGKETDEQGEG